MGHEDGGIFYSTIALSMATILAFGGIFAIYRLQEINTEISRTCNAFKEYIRRLIKFSSSSTKDKDSQEVDEWLNKDVFHNLLFRCVKNSDDVAAIDYFTQLNHQMDFRNRLQEEIWLPTKLIVATFLLSLLSFVFIGELHGYYLILWPFILLILATFAIIQVLKYIKIAIDGPMEENINNPLVAEFVDLANQRIAQIKDKIKSQLPIEKARIERKLRKQIKDI